MGRGGRLCVAVAVAWVGAAPARAEGGPLPAALVLVPDLTWSNAPPALDGFARANLSMRTANARSAAADVYLTLGKGARSAAPGDGLPLPGWPELVDHDASLHYGGTLGSVGQALLDGGRRRALVADDPWAAVVAATADGSPPPTFPGTTAGLEAALADADAIVVAVTAGRLPAALEPLSGTCTVVASASTPSGSRHLGVLATSPACGLGTAGLASATTHHAHLATLPDVSRTFLDLVGVPIPPSVGGAVVTPAAAVDRVALVERDRRTWTADRARTPFVWLFVGLHVMGAAIAVGWPRARVVVACVLLAVPPAGFLMMAVPWWRGGAGVGLLVGGLVSAVIAFGGLRFARRDPVLAVGGLAALAATVVAVDALFGSPLQIDAPFGNSPVVGGRFYGVGNIGSGFLAAGLLVAGGLALDRWGRRLLPWVAGAVGAGAVAGGAPPFGADVGGVLFAVPAYGLLLLGTLRERVTPRHLLLLAGAAVSAVALFAAVDLARDAGSRTHLAAPVGRDDLVRKAERALLTVKAPMANVVGAAVAALALVRYSPGPRRALRAASYGVVVAAVLGSLVNDSGLNVAAAVLAVAWPVGVVVGARRPA